MMRIWIVHYEGEKAGIVFDGAQISLKFQGYFCLILAKNWARVYSLKKLLNGAFFGNLNNVGAYLIKFPKKYAPSKKLLPPFLHRTLPYFFFNTLFLSLKHSRCLLSLSVSSSLSSSRSYLYDFSLSVVLQSSALCLLSSSLQNPW